MRTIVRLLELASPLDRGSSLTIENRPWPDLIVRDLQREGPHRLPTLSVAHRYECSGQWVCAPEMLFEVEPSRKTWILTPYCLRDERAGIDQHSVYLKGGRIAVNYQFQAEHMSFARAWNKCLEQQGFVEAFQRSSFVGQLRKAFDREAAAHSSWSSEQLTDLLERALNSAEHPPNT
jgi:hypothetical protein